MRHDDIHLEPDELGGELGKAVVLTFGKAKLDDDVLALDVTQIAQSRPECIDAGGPCRGRGHSQKPDPRNVARLLSEPRQRRRSSAPPVARNCLRPARFKLPPQERKHLADSMQGSAFAVLECMLDAAIRHQPHQRNDDVQQTGKPLRHERHRDGEQISATESLPFMS